MIRGAAPARRSPNAPTGRRGHGHESGVFTRSGGPAPKRSWWAWGFEFLFFTLIAAGLAVAVVAVASGAWQAQPILSGSMRPGFSVGGVVVAQRVPLSELQVRDVIIFHPPSEPSVDYVHRVISLQRQGSTVVARTQGDANLYPDPWTLHIHGRYVYVARFTLPLLGYVAVWVHSSAGHRTMLAAAFVSFGGLAGFLLYDGLRRRRASAGGVDGGIGRE